ncbi:MAG: 23S rRNA (uracil(1939)-C(5))-methyltransferase RlmD [Clostridiales bacterium]|jgi:23S rRNA (uracil1939-C5)-methyltransferase|nr:23S rRNA (uracil(1939)-C(5))-methyltransferase RlmD [Clostridiales bacterium]
MDDIMEAISREPSEILKAISREPGEILIEITDIGSEGEGIGRLDGLAVFVPGGFPGDAVRARITSRRSGFARAEMTGIVRPSADRVPPICANARCGGCPLSGFSYSAQLRFKRKRAADALVRIGGADGFVWDETAPSEPDLPCRWKASFGVSRGRVGFAARGSRDIVEPADCPVIQPAHHAVLEAVRADIPGWLRGLIVRVSSVSGETSVTLVSREADPDASAVVSALSAAGASQIALAVNADESSPANAAEGLPRRVIYGRNYITERIGGVTLKLSPASFFQVNPPVARKLHAKALEFAGVSGGETVVDAYCGVGALALMAARRAGRVVGLELSPEAVANARLGARINKTANAEFVAGPAERTLGILAGKGLRPDVIFADPPRRGLSAEFIGAAAEASPARVIYISCDPATMARDVKRFTALGYAPGRAAVFDMFPHTSETETALSLLKVRP